MKKDCNRVVGGYGLWIGISGMLLLGGCAEHVGVPQASKAPVAVTPSSVVHPYAAPPVSTTAFGPIGGHNQYLSNAELAALPRFLRVHFAFNSSHINTHGHRITQDNAHFLLRFPHVDVRLEGNCDQRGTQEYNLALGERRAEAVKRLLEADGVPAGRIQTVSFGKDNLLCTQNRPNCWRRNRRVDFVYHAILPHP